MKLAYRRIQQVIRSSVVSAVIVFGSFEMAWSQTLCSPGAIATGGTISCANPCVTLTSSTVSGDQFLWSGPFGFTSTEQNPQVCVPGAYAVAITNTSGGCISYDSVIVTADTLEPILADSSDILTCTNPCVTINLFAVNAHQFNWTGPNDFESTEQSPLVCVRGIYTVVATNTTNGCTATRSVTIQKRSCVDLWKANIGLWPVLQLNLGDSTYERDSLLAILETPVGSKSKADASLILAHQLIAAKLNVADGSSLPQKTADAIVAADVAIGGSSIPMKIRPNSSKGQTLVHIASDLEDYNEGVAPPDQPPILLKPGAEDLQSERPVSKRPTAFALFQNYPNPFNPTTSINYTLPVTSRVRLQVFNTLGQYVETLLDEIQPPGEKTLQWDGRSQPSGIYLCKLTAIPGSGNEAFVRVMTMILAR